VARIGELGTTLAVTSNQRTLRRNTKCAWCSVSVPGEGRFWCVYRYCWQRPRLCGDGTEGNGEWCYGRLLVPSSPILLTLMKEALSSSETSVLTIATRRNILEDAILRSHHRENLKSYTARNFLMTSTPAEVRTGYAAYWPRLSTGH
jgi:hypothetical protein